MKPQMKEQQGPVIRIYTDGAGCRPDGKGSGFAWIRLDSNEKQVVREDGLTNNQAEYRAILAALESLPEKACAHIFSDSENTCLQLQGLRRVVNSRLAELHIKIHALIRARGLAVEYTWISRQDNVAGKLI